MVSECSSGRSKSGGGTSSAASLAEFLTVTNVRRPRLKQSGPTTRANIAAKAPGRLLIRSAFDVTVREQTVRQAMTPRSPPSAASPLNLRVATVARPWGSVAQT